MVLACKTNIPADLLNTTNSPRAVATNTFPLVSLNGNSKAPQITQLAQLSKPPPNQHSTKQASKIVTTVCNILTALDPQHVALCMAHCMQVMESCSWRLDRQRLAPSLLAARNTRSLRGLRG